MTRDEISDGRHVLGLPWIEDLMSDVILSLEMKVIWFMLLVHWYT